MSVFYAVYSYLLLQRLMELALANRNNRLLKARGGIEYGGGLDYACMVALHVGWLAALPAIVAPNAPVSIPVLAIFILLQAMRGWVMVVLGQLWTTRVIVVPGRRRVREGPFRYTPHPGYLVVFLEIVAVPLMFGAWQLATIAALLKLLVLRSRIRIENKALAKVYGD